MGCYKDDRPELDGVVFNCLSFEYWNMLEAPFSMEEVKEVVWLGYYFHARGKLPKSIMASFLELIQKIDSPQQVEDYRPICLIGYLYRLLSKLLAGRLKKVIGKLVSPIQSAFIEGRQMMDGVVVLNEPSGKICGVKRSPARGSNVPVYFSSCCGGFHGFQFNQQIHFELLQFANDTVMLCDGSLDNLWCVKAVLRGFERVFGLCINFNKSKIYSINIGEDMLTAATNFLPCEIGRLPFLFHGLPIGANHRRKDTWKPIFNKLSRRLVLAGDFV
ncbi:uncharacterized protein LOC131624426 [Vicia villosa]|uniref:uncharacterized protein LOC131624426 n=1 Tax=Vicia villosa TaxID=3911 RepID=UPI00273B91FB|nr:uncharacterized protein LOC131624426 [Vicia villosa]